VWDKLRKQVTVLGGADPPRRVCDMLMPLEAQVESLHASAVAFLRPQSFSLRGHQHPAGRERARLYTPALVTPALLLLTRG
jgi:hypothetical protein